MSKLSLFCCAVFTAALVASMSVAQSPYGQERARAIGELTDEAIAAALNEDGRVSMSGGFFEFDSAELTGTAPEVLFKIANVMKTAENMRIAIVGHSDSTGDFNYNVELSRLRAEAVRNELLEEPYNVEADRLVAMGAGSIAPVVSNKSEEGRALNRRIEFVLLNEEMMQ